VGGPKEAYVLAKSMVTWLGEMVATGWLEKSDGYFQSDAYLAWCGGFNRLA
jgi:hypothetical protein